ncbi:MAG TPA: protein kinase [Gemmatimonadaceae bacterium]|nr:protein kinase [Gemmatimonadaceae bacterium]
MADAKISSISKYRIIELVGEGAMGVVYKAQDSVLERTVAIKVMNDSIARQDDLRKRFLHEAQAAGSLQHPNVVCIYDLGDADGHLFIAMEFVDGVDLEHLIALGQPLSLQSKLDIVIDVLTGLAFAHRRGIVHRDIKPANIRVGEDGRAKIMDFGVAHLASSSMTSTGSILGTPTYMAPEQITEGKTSPATDIFAVGGVLYQILTLMKPFDAPTLQNLFFKIITEKPRSVTELMPALPPALDRIVQKAMAKEPSQRYSNALEMANDLTEVRSKLSGPSYPASTSLSASVASAIEQSRQTRRLRARKIAFIGGGALAAMALIGIAWSQFPRSNATKTAAAETPVAAAPAPALPSPPAGNAPATTNTRVATAQAEPVRQDRPPATSRETRTAAVKPTPKPVPSRVATAPVRQNVTPPPPALTTRQEPLPAPPQVVAAAPVVTAPKQEVPPKQDPAPSTPAAPTASDIGPAVEAFARAIESKDIGTIRREFPGLTAEQVRRFEQFFVGARSINATFRVASVEGSGSSAVARLEGNYTFVTTEGVTEHQPVSFTVTLRPESRGWRLASMR